MPIIAADAATLEAARNAYAYPQGLVVEADGPPAHEFNGAFPFDFCRPDAPTDLAFDQSLTGLLRAHDGLLRRRGLATVVYWGHLNAGYARYRVSRLVYVGQVQRLALAAAEVLVQLDLASQHADGGQLGEALGSLYGVSQLSGLAFASKVIAFLEPQRAGVLDSKIMRALTRWSHLPAGDTGLQARLGAWAAEGGILLPRMGAPVCRRRVKDAYQAWCGGLEHGAVTLNTAGSAWTDVQVGQQSWRAIDVERAIFNLVS